VVAGLKMWRPMRDNNGDRRAGGSRNKKRNGTAVGTWRRPAPVRNFDCTSVVGLTRGSHLGRWINTCGFPCAATARVFSLPRRLADCFRRRLHLSPSQANRPCRASLRPAPSPSARLTATSVGIRWISRPQPVNACSFSHSIRSAMASRSCGGCPVRRPRQGRLRECSRQSAPRDILISFTVHHLPGALRLPDEGFQPCRGWSSALSLSSPMRSSPTASLLLPTKRSLLLRPHQLLVWHPLCPSSSKG
jgi:hypothetical protein